MSSVTIVGGGLSGALLAIFLARRGHHIEVFERRKDVRLGKAERGRSINMALSARGMKALSSVGLLDRVLGDAVALKGRRIHGKSGELTFFPYGRTEDQVIASISRAQLNAILLDAAEAYPNVRIHFDKCVTGYDIDTKMLSFRAGSSGRHITMPSEVVIGTDGSASELRRAMMRVPLFNFSQDYLEHSYKELHIPAGSSGDYQMEKEALHIWPRESFMLIALPNPDGSFTVTLFLQRSRLAKLCDRSDVLEFFRSEFPDTLDLMPDLASDFFRHPTGHLVTVRCFPWHIQGDVLLLGDAAHAIVPFYGQGMNCSFEDCRVLDEVIEEVGQDWNEVFSKFQRLRKTNTDAIADLANENFIEMRDHVADPVFLLRRQLEHALEEAFPEHYISKYSMVTFHHTPYRVALERGRAQEKVLSQVCEGKTSLAEINLEEVLSILPRKN